MTSVANSEALVGSTSASVSGLLEIFIFPPLVKCELGSNHQRYRILFQAQQIYGHTIQVFRVVYSEEYAQVHMVMFLVFKWRYVQFIVRWLDILFQIILIIFGSPLDDRVQYGVEYHERLRVLQVDGGNELSCPILWQTI